MPSPGSVPSFQQTSSPAAIDPGLPRVGEWLWACRPGFESDLIEEFTALRTPARAIEPGLVASRKRPQGDLVFARQGLPIHAVLPLPAAPFGAHGATDQNALFADRIVREIAKHLGSGKGRERPLVLQIFTPDSDEGRLRIKAASALQAAIAERLSALPLRLVETGTEAHAEAGLIAQVCLFVDPRAPGGKGHQGLGAAVGVISATSAISLFAGGVNRVRRPEGSPSRSAHKLVEALSWLGHGPEAGDICVDLGAAPGGFSLVLADRRCQVIAVDLGRLDPQVARRVKHVRLNAFHFIPDEPADWVFCDMAYRPLEVAALLARWGRSHWARFLVSNIKLPMKRRVELLDRVRDILETGGWTGMRMRQLYHDRDEITLFAWRGFGMERARRPAAAEQGDSDDQPNRQPNRQPDRRPDRQANQPPNRQPKHQANRQAANKSARYEPRSPSQKKPHGKAPGKAPARAPARAPGKAGKPSGSSSRQAPRAPTKTPTRNSPGRASHHRKPPR